MKLKDAINEGTDRFGKLDVNDIREIIPKHSKLLQQFLTKNRGGTLQGIAFADKPNYLLIVGDAGLVYIDMTSLKPMRTSLLVK